MLELYGLIFLSFFLLYFKEYIYCTRFTWEATPKSCPSSAQPHLHLSTYHFSPDVICPVNPMNLYTYGVHMHACMHAQLCPTPCDPMDCGPPGSSFHGIFEEIILEWVAVSSSRGSSWSGVELESLVSPALAWGFFHHCATWETPDRSM